MRFIANAATGQAATDAIADAEAIKMHAKVDSKSIAHAHNGKRVLADYAHVAQSLGLGG